MPKSVSSAITGLATFSDPAGVGVETTADFTATINWGDSSTSTGTVSYDGNTGRYAVAGGHTYADDGSYSVSVAVTDQGGAPPITISGSATIADAALAGSGAAVVSGTEGATAQLVNATFTDANAGDHHGDFTATTARWERGAGRRAAGSAAFSTSRAGTATFGARAIPSCSFSTSRPRSPPGIVPVSSAAAPMR